MPPDIEAAWSLCTPFTESRDSTKDSWGKTHGDSWETRIDSLDQILDLVPEPRACFSHWKRHRAGAICPGPRTWQVHY